MKILFFFGEPNADGRTDKQTEYRQSDEANSRISQFCKHAQKNTILVLFVIILKI